MKKIYIYLIVFVVLLIPAILSISLIWQSTSFSGGDQIDSVDYTDTGNNNTLIVCDGTNDLVRFYNSTGYNIKNSSSINLNPSFDPVCSMQAFVNSTNNHKESIFVLGDTSIYVLNSTGSEICNAFVGIGSPNGREGRLIDQNGDGKLNEFVFANKVLYAYNESCDQIFATTVNSATGRRSSNLEVGDLDNDGYKNDIAIINQSDSTSGRDYDIDTFNSDGSLYWRYLFPSSIRLKNIEIGNVTSTYAGDELFAVYTFSTSNTLNLTMFSGFGTLIWNRTITTTLNSNGAEGELIIGDFDGNGKSDDIFVAFENITQAYNSSGNLIWSNNINGTQNILDIGIGSLYGNTTKYIYLGTDNSTQDIIILDPYNGNVVTIIDSDSNVEGDTENSKVSILLTDLNGNGADELILSLINNGTVLYEQLDVSDPTVTLIYPTNTTYSNTITTLNSTVTDDGALEACWYSLNGGTTNTTFTCNTNITGLNSGEGFFHWIVYANDTTGNLGSDDVYFSVAFQGPTVTLINPTNNSNFTVHNNINLTFNASDPNGINTTEIWHNFNGVWSKNITLYDVTSDALYNYSYNITNDGNYTWNVNSTDTTNQSNWSINNYTFRVDSTGPSITFLNPSNNSFTSSSTVQINYTFNDSIAGINSTACKWSKNGGASNTSLTTCQNISDTFAVGSNNIDLWVYDRFGNEGYSRLIVTIDQTNPNVNITSPIDNSIFKDQYNYSNLVTVSISDTNLNTSYYSLNGGSNTIFSGSSFSLSILVAGINNLTVYANDSAGNTNSSSISFNLTFTPKINDINVSNSTTTYSRNTFNSTGLLGWYKFEENNTNQVDSANTKNATAVNASISQGVLGNGYSFTPNLSYLSITGDVFELSNESGTVVWWYKSNSDSYQTIFSNQQTGGISGHIEFCDSVGTGQCGGSSTIRFESDNNNQFIKEYTTGSVNIHDGNFHFYTFTMNTTATALYVDGIRTDVDVAADDFPGLTINYIGHAQSGIGTNYGGWANGTIDEVMIFNRSLDANEIYNIYSIKNPTFEEYPNITINVSVTDEDTSIGSIVYTWFLQGVQVISGIGQNIFNWVLNQQYNNVTLIVNDTSGYNVSIEFNITTESNPPTIDFTSPTPLTGQNTTNTSITFNLTGTEANINSSWVSFNATNYTASCSGNPYSCSVTVNNLEDNFYSYTGYINDSYGNQNNTETRYITIDNTNPTISITTPVNYYNSSSSTIQINYTSSDTNREACFYSINGTTNTTTSCTNSGFNIAYSEGLNNVTVYVNDSAGNTNSDIIYFYVDTTNPLISYINFTEANITYLNKRFIGINITSNDTYFKNLTVNLYNSGLVNSSSNTTNGNHYINFSVNQDGIYYFNATILDWTGNSNSTLTRNVTVDTTNPLISYVSPTQNNDSNLSQNWIYINLSINDINFKNITYNLYNTSLVNSTAYSTNTSFINFTNLADGTYYYNTTVYDQSNNSNSTETRQINLDTTKPSFTILYPTNTTYRDQYNYSLVLNSSSSDSGVGIQNYTYVLNSGTNTTFSPNTTLIGLVAAQNNLSVYTTDYAGNINASSVSFYLGFTPKINDINISNTTDTYTRNAINTTDLLIWWKLDENNTNQIDSSGNNYNLTIDNSKNVTFVNNGKIGGGIRIDRNNSDRNIAYFKDSGKLTKTPYNKTYMLWAKMDSFDSGSNQGLIDDSVWRIRFSGNNVSANVGRMENNSGVAFGTSEIIDLDINRWYLYTLIYAPNPTVGGVGYFELLVDGVSIERVNISNLTYSQDYGDDFVRLGSSWHGSWQPINGTVDEVMIFNRTLSASEIQDIYYVTNPTFQEYDGTNNITINASITDEDTSAVSLVYTWYVNSVQVLSGIAQYLFSWIYTQDNNNVTLIVNDTSGYNVSQEFNITINNINPLISFVSPTENDHASVTQNWIFANVSITEINENNITFSLFDSTNQTLNSTLYLVGNRTINWTSLSDGIYYYNVTIRDIAGNENSTETRQITLDNGFPVVTILYPDNNQNFSTQSVNVNFSATDTGLDTCWWTNDSGATNTTVGCTSNITGTWPEGVNTVIVYANDSSNNQGSDNVIFTVDLTNPLIDYNTTNMATNNTYVSQNWIYVNTTVTETNEKNITFDLYNSTGLVNSTTYTDKTHFINFTNLGEKVYYYNVTVRDWTNHTNSTVTGNVILDTTSPSISVLIPSNKSYSSTSTNFAISVTDTNSISACWYILDSGNNVTLPNIIVTLYKALNSSMEQGFHIVNYYCNDTAGNLNSDETVNFTIDTIDPILTFQNQTLTNNTFVNQNYIELNISINEINPSNITFYLYNSTYYNLNTTLKTSIDNSSQYLNFSSLNNGIYYYNATLIDNAGNSNSTETRKITLDTTSPTVTITSPVDYFNSSSASLQIDFTATDTNREACFYSINGTTNTTTSCSTGSFTNSYSEGVNNVTIYSNDSASNEGNDLIYFTIDLTDPIINYVSGTQNNDSNLSQSQIFVNVSVSETNLKNVTYYLYNSALTLINTTNYESNTSSINFTSLSDGIYYYNVTTTDWSGRKTSVTTRKITLDTNNPGINLSSPSNNSFVNNATQNYTVNGSDNLGIKNVSIYIYNSTDILINSTTINNTEGGIINQVLGNVFNLAEGVYKWFSKIFDWTGNSNNTQNYTITIDLTDPSITIVSPANTTYTTTSISILYNVNETYNNSCWYSIDNGATNNTLTNCANSSLTASQGSNTVIIYANDTAGNEGASSVTFFVDSISPIINFISPTENNHANVSQNYIIINTSITETNFKNLTFDLYNSTLYFINSTTYTNSSRSFNYTNLANDIYYYNVTTYDTLNNTDSTEARVITIDTVYPLVNITNVTTTLGLQTVQFNHTTSDTYLKSCKYSVFDSSGIDGSLENVSVTCNSNNNQYVVSNFGTFNLTLYVIDWAGNENSTNYTFTTVSNSTTPSTGGGGNTNTGNKANVSWSMTTENEGDNYQLQMAAFSLREKEIIFKNDGVEDVKLKLRCIGGLCDGITFSRQNLTLPIGLNVEHRVNLVLQIPQTIQDAVYNNSIIATDQNGNSKLISINVNVGGSPDVLFIEGLTKIGSESKVIGGINIPYLVIFSLLWILIGLIIFYLWSYRFKVGIAIALILGIIISFILIYFV